VTTPETSQTQERSRKRVIRDEVDGLFQKLVVLPGGINGQVGEEVTLFSESLTRLGPVFIALGDYLGTRADLLRPEICQSLGRQHLAAFAPPPKPPEIWAGTLSPEPEQSTPLFHVFRWRGQPDTFSRILNEQFLADWEEDQKYLKLLLPAMKHLWPAQHHLGTLSNFQSHVERTIDLKSTKEQHQRFLEGHKDVPFTNTSQFQLTKIAGEFCAPNMISFIESTDSSHQTLREVVESNEAGSLGINTAKNLCLSWLTHILKGNWYPEEPSLRHLGLTSKGSLVILGGTLGSLSPETQDFFAQYFRMVASNQPDQASELLTNVLKPTRQAKSPREIRDLFRQIVPFRDGQINSASKHELFAEHVLCQWRIIVESGFRATSDQLAVIRSFSMVAHLVHRLSPHRDTFKDSVYEFRWNESLSDFQNLFTLGSALKQGQDWLSLMMEFPEKMKTFTGDSGLPRTPEETRAPQKPKQPSALLLIVCHLSVIGIMAWLLVTLLDHPKSNSLLIGPVILTVIGTSISLLRSPFKER